MPIHVILGKPGSGKSLLATSYTVPQLAETERNIVSNLPLHPGRLNEYLQKLHPSLDCRLPQRLRILTEVELRYFWKFRAPEDLGPPELYELADCVDEKRRDHLLKVLDAWARQPTLSDEGKGVAYFLDEAHIAFNAREWTSVAKSALFYLSQHRKLGDVVFVITQASGNLDKQFRSVAEDFTVVRNEYLAQYGPFRGRGRFVRRTYLTEPTGNQEPFEKVAFTLDKEGIASCYDTARGIGVHGSKADIGRRAKGISIWWAVVGAFALAALCGAVPWLLGKAAAAAMTKGKQVQAAAAAAAAAPSSPATVPAPVSSATFGSAVHAVIEPVGSAGAPEDPLYVTGVVRMGRKIRVQLSDGRLLTEHDLELTRAQPGCVWWNGRRLWVMARPPRQSDVPSTSPALPSPPASTQPAPAAAQVDDVARFDTRGEVPGKSTYRL